MIVKYILQNNREIPKLSAKELAGKVFTSSATVVRLCQRMGLQGYREFKVQFAAEIAQEEYFGGGQQHSISNRDDIRSIMEKVTGIEADALRETYDSLDPASIMKAVYLIDHAEHIDFYAMDNNLNIADMASYALLHVGKFSTVCMKNNAQYLHALTTTKGHVSIIISRTGKNRRLMEIAELLKKRSSQILLLTSEKDSPLAEMADEVLYAVSEKKINELGSFVFMLTAKYLVDILYSVLFSRHYESAVCRDLTLKREFSRSN
jgi:DNA-binding MurR/RpiR family transcriptional regulator